MIVTNRGFALLIYRWSGTVRRAGPVCAASVLVGLAAMAVDSEAAEELDVIEVVGRAQDLTGIATSASQGRVGQDQLEERPLLRPGEVLELIPGLLATQHSGTGKAQQYFLRGFNLDHGTDFATSIDGVPFNMPTHGHGQGYLDLNPLIPELIESIDFFKGPYYASVGDFSSAGMARISTYDRLPRGIAKMTVGEDRYLRGLLADSTRRDTDNWLYALEFNGYDGPWENPEDVQKFNAVLKRSTGTRANGWTVIGTLYDADWNSTDQIPLRAVQSGGLSRFGTLNPSDGGASSRYSVALDWHGMGGDHHTGAMLYAVRYDFDLYSDFTFFQDDPINGDQIYQKDRRWIYGGNATHTLFGNWNDRELGLNLGAQLRHDDISEVGLFHTRNRQILSTMRSDSVNQTSASLFAELEIPWTSRFRSIIGLRGDYYRFDVNSDLGANSGSESDAVLGPKLSLTYGPWHGTELFFNAGQSFHSNDARGTTIQVDPSSGLPANPVDPLVKSRGSELGLRTQALLPGLNTTLALWYLKLDSELLFVGDAGSTEATSGSRRYGLEWTNYYQPNDWLTLDLDLALSQARYNGGGDVPGSVGRVIAAGIRMARKSGLFANLRVRHFGDVPLIEDGSVTAGSTTLVNVKAGLKYRDWGVDFDVLNLLNSDDRDITYYYESQLASEAVPVKDIHFHPVEPRSARMSVHINF